MQQQQLQPLNNTTTTLYPGQHTWAATRNNSPSSSHYY